MNDVFEMVNFVGLPVADFQWRIERLEHNYHGGASYCNGSALYHVESQFFYKFGEWSDVFSPGRIDRVQTVELSTYASSNRWEQRTEPVLVWLSRLKEELDAPDLWNELITDRNAYTIATVTTRHNDRFTTQETSYVAVQLQQVRQQLQAAHDLTAVQTRAIEKGFAEIVQSMNSYGKKDWFNQASGLLVNIAVAYAFSPAAASDLYHRFVAAVAPLFEAVMNLLS
jgi:hypothetical protein